MLKLMKQARAAFSMLSADEMPEQAAKPLHVGLVADGSGAYAEMEEFLVPAALPRAGMAPAHGAGAPRQRRRRAGQGGHRALRAGTSRARAGRTHFIATHPEHDRCRHSGATRATWIWRWRGSSRAFRKPVMERDHSMVSRENALFAVATALPNIVPSMIELPWAFGEFASDTAFLTANQVRMAFQIAAACGKDVGLGAAEGRGGAHRRGRLRLARAGARTGRAKSRSAAG